MAFADLLAVDGKVALLLIIDFELVVLWDCEFDLVS